MTVVSRTASNDTITSASELDESSLSAIRSILTEEDAPAPKRGFGRKQSTAAASPEALTQVGKMKRSKAEALPRLRKPLEDPDAVAKAEAILAAAAEGKKPRRGFSLRRKATEQPIQTETPKPVAAPQAPAEAREAGGLLDRLRGYRPKVGHVVLAALALFILFRPWLFLGLTILFILILVGVFLTVGYDGFWQGTMKLSRWYASRRPDRAAAMHARLDGFAVKWDAVLDRFPEGTVDALYLPDFGALATAERRHEDAMERRLAGLEERGA